MTAIINREEIGTWKSSSAAEVVETEVNLFPTFSETVGSRLFEANVHEAKFAVWSKLDLNKPG